VRFALILTSRNALSENTQPLALRYRSGELRRLTF